MNSIKSAAVVVILALGAASAAAVAPAAAHLHAGAPASQAGQAQRSLQDQTIDPALPTMIIIGKRAGRAI